MPYSAEHDVLTRQIAAEEFAHEPATAAAFYAMIRQECGFDLDVITGRRDSTAGARGIAQLMPVHWSQVDPLDPPAALRYAAAYLRSLTARYGDLRAGVAAYNCGPGTLDRLVAAHGPHWEAAHALPHETRAYLAAVFGAGAPVAPAPAPDRGAATVATVTAPYGLRLRATPSDSGPVLAVAPHGMAVQMRRDAWYPVRYAERDGWMWGGYLTLNAPRSRAAAVLALARLLLAWEAEGDRAGLDALHAALTALTDEIPGAEP